MSERLKSFDIASIDSALAYRVLIGSIVPRPVAWISTRGKDGSTNLSPFSFFMGVSAKPLCLAFSSSAKSDGSIKDTLRNVLETGEFVVNVVTEELASQANLSSAEFEYGVSEFERASLTAIPSLAVKAPRLSESPIQLECKLEQAVPVGDVAAGDGATIVIGRVLMAHVREDLIKANTKYFEIDIEKLRPVSRLGGIDWGRPPVPFALERPKKP